MLLSLVGDLGSAGISVMVVVAFCICLTRSVSVGFVLAGGWCSAAADWPQMAFFMARAANTGAGVSGASI